MSNMSLPTKRNITEIAQEHEEDFYNPSDSEANSVIDSDSEYIDSDSDDKKANKIIKKLEKDNFDSKIVHSEKNETVDKVCDLLANNSALKNKINSLIKERDHLEEHLRKNIMEFNTKLIEFDNLKEENDKNSKEIMQLKNRIVNIRNKCLQRKRQVYALAILFNMSIVHILFPNFLYVSIMYYLIPAINVLLYSNNLIWVKNIIVVLTFIYALSSYINLNVIKAKFNKKIVTTTVNSNDKNKANTGNNQISPALINDKKESVSNSNKTNSNSYYTRSKNKK